MSLAHAAIFYTRESSMPNPDTLEARVLPTNIQVLSALDHLKQHLPQLFDALAKKINIAQILAESGTVGKVTVDRVSVGNVLVQSLTLKNTQANLASGNAYLEDVGMTLELRFKLHWWFDIEIYSDSGDEDLGSLWFSMHVGNVAVPSLANIQMNIPTVTVNNVGAQVNPLQNLDLGAAAFQKLAIKKSTLPTAGFTLSGLALGSLNLSGLGVPAMQSNEVTIQAFKPNQTVVIPSASLGNISIPSTAIPDVKSGGIDIDAVASSRGLKVDFGIFGFTFLVTPVVHMDIGSMTLHDLGLSASVENIDVANVHVPLDVKGITLKTLHLDDLTVNDVSL
jgi:hypothetical protein